MVETVVVMPVIITIWMTTLFAQKVCSSKLDTLAAARGKAWNYAAGNCGDAGDAGPGSATTGEGQKAAGGGAPKEFLFQLMGNPGEPTRAVVSAVIDTVFHVIVQPFGASKSSKEKSAQVSSKGGGALNFSANLTSKSTVMCNEAPLNGTFENVFKQIFQLFFTK